MDLKYEINKWKVRTVKYLLKYKQNQYYNTRPLNHKRIDAGDKSIMFITIAFNNARVVEEQIMRLQSMCQDEFIHVIADNSTDAEARVKIERVCDKVGATYYPLPNNNPFNNTNGSYSHGMALNYCWRNIISNCSKLKAVMFLDHDIFPTEKFSLIEKLKLDTYHPLKMGGVVYRN